MEWMLIHVDVFSLRGEKVYRVVKKKKVVETKRLARGSHWKHQNLLLSVRIVD